MNRIILCVLVAFATQLSYVQAKAPIKFGKVSQEELEMTQYDLDTSAVAVVLCKYGLFNSNDFRFTMTERVKILKKAGTSYSDYVFPSSSEVQVKAKVFNLVNGEIEEEKVKSDNVYKERVTDDYYRVRIALPNVKEGTVYDIQYSFVGLPFEFSFQKNIPVKHAEIYLQETPYVNFRKRLVGYLPVKEVSKNIFVSKDVPAFKKEAYISSEENYISKFEFDILEVSFPGYYKSYATSWESVNNRLNDNAYFGEALLNGAMYLSDIKKEIEAKYTEPNEKIKAAVEAIKQVQWDEHYSVYTNTKSLGSAFKDKKANAAEINLMLIQLLHKLDIDSYPVVLSTRSNGMLHPFYPTFDKLNYVIACAMVDGKEVLLDATENYMPVGMLPLRCLNGQGRLVDKDSGKWVDLTTDKKDNEVVMYDLTLDDDLNLNGKIDYARYDYAGFNFRKDYSEYANDEEYLKELEEDHPGLTVKNYEIVDVDKLDQPVKDSYEVKLSNNVSQVGDMIMINPFLFEAEDENPFKMEKREYPVDFGYKHDKRVISRIAIPENYQISEMPKPIRIVLPDKSASALINYQAIGNTINVTYNLHIGKPQYLMDEYVYLKSLYKAIIEKHAEPIILKPVQNAALL